MKILTPFLSPKAEGVYAFLRIVSGLMFAFHGMQILFNLWMPPGMHPHVLSQIWCGGIIELIAGVLIACGAFTTCAAFVGSGTMAVAYIQFHWKFSFGTNFFPALNQGEMSLLYSILFLYIACRGGGMASIDKSRNRRN